MTTMSRFVQFALTGLLSLSLLPQPLLAQSGSGTPPNANDSQAQPSTSGSKPTKDQKQTKAPKLNKPTNKPAPKPAPAPPKSSAGGATSKPSGGGGGGKPPQKSDGDSGKDAKTPGGDPPNKGGGDPPNGGNGPNNPPDIAANDYTMSETESGTTYDVKLCEKTKSIKIDTKKAGRFKKVGEKHNTRNGGQATTDGDQGTITITTGAASSYSEYDIDFEEYAINAVDDGKNPPKTTHYHIRVWVVKCDHDQALVNPPKPDPPKKQEPPQKGNEPAQGPVTPPDPAHPHTESLPPKQEQAPDLKVISLPTDNGIVRAFMLGDTPGNCSGRVVFEPNGKSKSELDLNTNALEGMVLDVNGKKSSVGSGVFSFALAAGAAVAAFTLSDHDGHPVTVNNCAVQTTQNAARPAVPGPSNQGLPTVVQAGRPAFVSGSFQGDLSKITATIGNTNCPVVAVNPHHAAILVPHDLAPGANKIVVTETQEINGVPQVLQAEGTTQCLNTQVNARRAQHPGEQSSLDITISGLNAGAAPLWLHLHNATPNTIQLMGGEDQYLAIPGGEVRNGTWKKTLRMTALQPGPFSVQADIVEDHPSDATSSISPDRKVLDKNRPAK